MNNSNLDIVLGNALCCSAQKAVELSDLLSQGNKCAKTKTRELKLLNDSINELLCHAYDIEATFNYILTCVSYNSLNTLVAPLGIKFYAEITTNAGTNTYSIQADGVSTYQALYLELCTIITELSNYSISDCVGYRGSISRTETISFTCDVIKVFAYIVMNEVLIDGTQRYYTNNQLGKCPDCLTETQITTLLNNIMTTCDICDCQLPTE